MKTRHRFLALVAAVALLPGCMFMPAQLEVTPHAATQVAGPLKDVGPVEFRAAQLEDARQDKARIGYKKNGFGHNTADITTSEPVDQIVEKTIAKAIVDSGHTLGDDGALQIVGSYSVDKAAGFKKTWTEVMAMALDKLIEDITLDEDMADALKAHIAAKGNTTRP